MTPHDYRPEQAKGFGRWMQCAICGTTKHCGYFWHGGFKSKVEPSKCNSWGFDAEWRESATPSPLEDQ